MIIGISGKAQSGKDTIGNIIQYLTTSLRHSYHFEDFINPNINYNYSSTSFPNYGSTWQIHKFADPLKDIVCILTGCTRDQLEDIDFKNSKLPDEWINYRIGINKFTSKENLIKRYKEEHSIEPSEYWINSQLCNLTYRQLLQTVGTDLFRNQLHENTWINALMSKYKPIDRRTWQDPDDSNISYPNWIITDVRFPNELKAIEDRSGFVIRVNRKQYIEYEGKIIETFNVHPSETGLDDYSFKYAIDNNNTIEELISKVKDVLIKEGILWNTL